MKINKYIKKKIEEFSENRANNLSNTYGFSNQLEVKEAFINATTLCLRFNLIRKMHKPYIYKIVTYYCKDVLDSYYYELAKSGKMHILLDKDLYHECLISSVKIIMRDTYYEYKNHNFFNSLSCICRRFKNCLDK